MFVCGKIKYLKTKYNYAIINMNYVIVTELPWTKKITLDFG